MGHTYLQKLAPRKSISIKNAETKYPRMMQAVAHGLSHNKKASYAHRYVTSRPAAIHLERRARGQRYRGNEAPAQIARHREGAGHAEQVAGNQQRDDGERAPVDPREDACKVHRSHLCPGEAIGDDRAREQEHGDLRTPAKMSISKDAADNRCTR